MKAIPMAQYLEQKARATAAQDWSAARRDSSPFKPRPMAAAEPEPEQGFRRSGLGAAVVQRAAEPTRLVRPIGDQEPVRRAASPFRARSEPEPAPESDIEEQLSEAYHRGVQEGLDAGKAEASTARALERADYQKRAVVERLDFQMNEYAKLSDTIASSFAEIERCIAEAVARILKPLVAKAVSNQIVEELTENVARLSRAGGIGLLRVRGPERLLSVLKARIESLAVDAEYVEEGGVEIMVSAQSTEIRSELGAWEKLIDSLVGGR